MTQFRVGVVGAGRVGAVLAAALRAAGHDIVAAAGESDASRGRIEALIPGTPVMKPSDAARAADLLLLTVPDDMLPNVVAMLCASGAIREGQLVVHTSGAQGLAVLGTGRGGGRAHRRPAPGDDLHRHRRRPAPAARGDLRRHRRRGRACRHRTARRRPRRSRHVGRGGQAHALPRRSGPRRQPPRHPGDAGDGDAVGRRWRQPGRHPAPAAQRSPRQRSRAGRRGPHRPDRPRRRRDRRAPTSSRSPPMPPRRSRPTSRWRAPPSTASSPTAGCCRSVPRRCARSSTLPTPTVSSRRARNRSAWA